MLHGRRTCEVGSCKFRRCLNLAPLEDEPHQGPGISLTTLKRETAMRKALGLQDSERFKSSVATVGTATPTHSVAQSERYSCQELPALNRRPCRNRVKSSQLPKAQAAKVRFEEKSSAGLLPLHSGTSRQNMRALTNHTMNHHTCRP